VLKQIGFAVIALIIFVGGVFVESMVRVDAQTSLDKDILVKAGTGFVLLREGDGQKVDKDLVLEVGDEIRTDKGGRVVVVFDDYGRIRVDENSSLVLVGKYEDGYDFNLKAGHVWVNSLYAQSRLNFKAGAGVIIPQRSVFSLFFDKGSTDVESFIANVYVGIIDEAFSFNKVMFSDDSSLVNHFLVSQGGKASISFSKVNKNVSVIKKLLYSKLIKEFHYSLIDLESFGDDDFYNYNVELDDFLKNKVEKDFKNKIDVLNLKYSSLDSLKYNVDSSFDALFSMFTFVESKREGRLLNYIFNNLFDSEYLFVYNRVDDASNRLALFKKVFNENFSLFSDEYKKKIIGLLNDEYVFMGFVSYEDNLMNVKSLLADLIEKYSFDDEVSFVNKLQIIRDFMTDAYLLAGHDDIFARQALAKYYSFMMDFIKSNSGHNLTYVLAEENQIMASLLRRYSAFYVDSVFGVKSFLEKKWIASIVNFQDQNEEKRVIISDKIDFLKNLKRFFLDNKVSLDDARSITGRLIVEIQNFQVSDDLGINELFDLRLKDYGVFLKFLNATSVTSIRNLSSKGAYEAYVARHKEQVSVADFMNNVVKVDKSESFNVSKIIDDINKDFSDIGVVDLFIGDFTSVDQKIVAIKSAKYKGVVFSGLYDWDKKLIIEVDVDGKKLGDGGVKIDSLPLVLDKVVVGGDEKKKVAR